MGGVGTQCLQVCALVPCWRAAAAAGPEPGAWPEQLGPWGAARSRDVNVHVTGVVHVGVGEARRVRRQLTVGVRQEDRVDQPEPARGVELRGLRGVLGAEPLRLAHPVVAAGEGEEA